MWNLLSIVREMYRRNDRNSIQLLEIVTQQCLETVQIMVWWFNSKVALQQKTHGKHNVNSTTQVSIFSGVTLNGEIAKMSSQKNPTALYFFSTGFPERVCLTLRRDRNPVEVGRAQPLHLTPGERNPQKKTDTVSFDCYRESTGMFELSHLSCNFSFSRVEFNIICRPTFPFQANPSSSGASNLRQVNNNNNNSNNNNNNSSNNSSKTSRPTELELFSGFKPAIEACSLDWSDYPIPGVTYGHNSHYLCPFTVFRLKQNECGSQGQVRGQIIKKIKKRRRKIQHHLLVPFQVNSSQAVLRCEYPSRPRSSSNNPNNNNNPQGGEPQGFHDSQRSSIDLADEGGQLATQLMPQAVLDAMQLQASSNSGGDSAVAGATAGAAVGRSGVPGEGGMDDGQLSSLNSEEITSDEGTLDILSENKRPWIENSFFLGVEKDQPNDVGAACSLSTASFQKEQPEKKRSSEEAPAAPAASGAETAANGERVSSGAEGGAVEGAERESGEAAPAEKEDSNPNDQYEVYYYDPKVPVSHIT